VDLESPPDAKPEEPPPGIRYRRALHIRSSIREFWGSRHVIYSLGERDLRARYSQTILGFVWNIAGPFAMMVVITFVLNKTNTQVPGNVEKPIWVNLALLPWGFFQGAVANGGMSLVSNNALLNKVYAPREVFPIAQIGVRIVDTTMQSAAFIGLLVFYGFVPKSTSFWAVIPLLIAFTFTSAVTILLSALTVYFRDLRQAIPLVLQLGLFFNPIAYDLSEISSRFQPYVVAINPLAGAIDGLRRCVLYGQAPRVGVTVIAGVSSLLMLMIAYPVFKQLEAGIADVA
jgi:ABC-2 type transport system permease protein/lipopolysaccharide transport system permease protein